MSDAHFRSLSYDPASPQQCLKHLRSLLSFSLSLLISVGGALTLMGCPNDTGSLDAGLSDMIFTDDGGAPIDMRASSEMGQGGGGMTCDSLDSCSTPECADSPICQPCEEGGSCLYSGTLKIFGQALSSSGQVISDLTVRATCGQDQIETLPGEEGRYELTINVNQCSHLVMTVERGANTESYVPSVRRIQMPPPVNTIEINFRLIPGEEIRCDGITCSSQRAFGSFDTQSFYVGYAYNSGELNELNNFGAIFESIDGELLWLHRFSFYEFRDNQSQTLYDIFFGDQPKIYALSRLSFETRAWVTDLHDLSTFADYHTQEHSIYWNNDERWLSQVGGLTDPLIDPDGDGRFNGIEMNAYQLDLERAQWRPVESQGELIYSQIVAEVEAGYDNSNNMNFTGSTIESALYAPNKVYAFVPDAYLRGVQTTGMYGPGYAEDVSLGQYRSDYSAIPVPGSGVFAVGQPIPKTCWRIKVTDECDAPVFGAPVEARGVSHGYFTEGITDSNGLTCIEVGRSESMGLDFDGDNLSNELFDVEIEVKRVLGDQRLRPPMAKIESTPINEGSCREVSACEEVRFTFSGCAEQAQP